MLSAQPSLHIGESCLGLYKGAPINSPINLLKKALLSLIAPVVTNLVVYFNSSFRMTFSLQLNPFIIVLNKSMRFAAMRLY